MSKTARHKAILNLLEEGRVGSQDSLQQKLKRKGFDVGQATLSRDLRELKLVKGPEGYRGGGESLARKRFAVGDPSCPPVCGRSPAGAETCSW